MKEGVKFIFLLLICLTQSSCIIAAAGAGIAAVKYANSKKAAAESKKMDSYNQYAIEMEKINTERQAKGLAPSHVMTYQEYCKED